jgi:hypothetical protein
VQALDPVVTKPAPFLIGGGETGELIRSHDWSTTSLGSVQQWPQSLKSLMGVALASPLPMVVL